MDVCMLGDGHGSIFMMHERNCDSLFTHYIIFKDYTTMKVSKPVFATSLCFASFCITNDSLKYS